MDYSNPVPTKVTIYYSDHTSKTINLTPENAQDLEGPIKRMVIEEMKQAERKGFIKSF